MSIRFFVGKRSLTDEFIVILVNMKLNLSTRRSGRFYNNKLGPSCRKFFAAEKKLVRESLKTHFPFQYLGRSGSLLQPVCLCFQGYPISPIRLTISLEIFCLKAATRSNTQDKKKSRREIFKSLQKANSAMVALNKHTRDHEKNKDNNVWDG